MEKTNALLAKTNDILEQATQKGGKRKSKKGGKRKVVKGSWMWAVKTARKELGVTGFQAIKKGTPLYNRAKELQH